MLPETPPPASHVPSAIDRQGDPGWNDPPPMASGHDGIAGAAASRPPDRLDHLLRLGTAAALALILGLSAFLQFYRPHDLQHFQGDAGVIVLPSRPRILTH